MAVRPARPFVLILLALLVLLVPSPAHAAATGCRSTQKAGPVIADTPWPQRRYDLAALGQLATGAGVTVAVIDSGVDATNPHLAGAVVTGADMLAGSDGREDCGPHGTVVASIIAARPVSGVGLRGLAPGATILPIRVSERTESTPAPTAAGDIGDLVAGIRYAVSKRPGVINLSISTTKDNPGLRAAIAEAIAADIVVVAAVGNDHKAGDPTTYPAAYDGVVGVGAIGPDSLRVATSQMGSYVDIVAPGKDIVGALPVGGHGLYEGTSFAAPFVSATAALIRSRWPSMHQADVVARLLATTDPAPGARPSAEYGYGVLSPLRAVSEVVLAAGTVPPATPVPIGQAALPAGSSPSVLALTAAGILAAAAVTIALITAAVPAGRRRRWRPPPSH